MSTIVELSWLAAMVSALCEEWEPEKAAVVSAELSSGPAGLFRLDMAKYEEYFDYFKTAA